MADARVLAAILGFDAGTGPAAPAAARWYVSDLLSAEYGSEVPAAAVSNPAVMIQRDDVGLVQIDNKWVSAIRIAADSSWDAYREKVASGKARDPRLLGDHRDSEGVRRLAFRDAIRLMKEVKFTGYPLKGPRAAYELAVAIRDAG